MGIYRAERPRQNFTIMANEALRDDRLSYRARGLLAVILSHSPEWHTTSETLAATGKEGRDAIRTALNELEEAGYLRRERRNGPDGRWATQAVVYDTPHAEVKTEQLDLFDSPEPINPAQAEPAQAGPASIEELSTEGSAPAERVIHPADQVATSVYEAMGKMGKYIALRQIALKALNLGHGPETVQAAMLAVWDAGKPVVAQSVAQALKGQQGGSIKGTNHDYWQGGGGFAATQEGPTP